MSRKIRILIIDDLPSARQQLKTDLKSRGQDQVLEAAEATEGLSLLQSQRAQGEPVDLIFCDWNMPGRSGLELLRELRSKAEYRNVPVIMFTTEGAFEQVKQAVASGATNYLTKPYKPEALFEKLEFVIEKYRLGKT